MPLFYKQSDPRLENDFLPNCEAFDAAIAACSQDNPFGGLESPDCNEALSQREREIVESRVAAELFGTTSEVSA
ncbi:MAG: hypothetical protein WC498_01500 [Candidatus Saccharimonadales bacterium]